MAEANLGDGADLAVELIGSGLLTLCGDNDLAWCCLAG